VQNIELRLPIKR